MEVAMEITEVRIKLMDGVQDRLLGFCSITFDRSFVVRDLKIIKGSRGAFVQLPPQKPAPFCLLFTVRTETSPESVREEQ
jgi:stage V sporulation protein G